MSQVTTGVPNIPTLPANTPKEISSAFNALKAWFADVSARGGLVVSGTSSVATGVGGGEGGGGEAPPTPPAISGLKASGGFDQIVLTWDQPVYPYGYFVEIWRSSTNDRDASVNVGMTHGQMYVDTPPDSRLSVTYYYWARIVNLIPEAGPWNAGQYDGADASTADEPGYVIELLLNSKWKPSTGYTEGFYVYPTIPNGFAYFATVGGTSGGTEPVWPTVIGNTVEDGEVTWRCEVNMDLETPFVIGVVGGKVKMVISDALIEDLSVTDAKIKSVNADKLTAGEAAIWEAIINTGKIGNAFIGSFIESDNYSPGESGWHINKSGLCEFHNGVFRGTVIVEGDHGFGANMIPNPDWYRSIPAASGQFGWAWYVPGGTAGWNVHQDWMPPGINTFWCEQPNAEQGNAYVLHSYPYDLIPIKPAKHYCLSGYTGAYDCEVKARIQWRDSSSNYISNSVGTVTNNNEKRGGSSLEESFKRIHVIAKAPANAAYAVCCFDKVSTLSGYSRSVMFVCRPQLEEANAYQLGPSPWKQSAMGSNIRTDNWTKPGYTLIDGNKIYTGDAYVDTLQIKANAVTIPVSQTLSGPVELPKPERPDLWGQQVTLLTTPWFDPQGGNIVAMVCATFSSPYATIRFRLIDHVWGGLNLYDSNPSEPYTPTIHTYSYMRHMYGVGPTYVTLYAQRYGMIYENCTVLSASLVALGTKR